jgi:hypothetical protein
VERERESKFPLIVLIILALIAVGLLFTDSSQAVTLLAPSTSAQED